MLSGNDGGQFMQKTGHEEAASQQEIKEGTMGDEDLKNIRGLDTFSHEYLHPQINNQAIFGLQAAAFNVMRSNAANS